jgi:NADH-quinone oxidoreductase subunit F
MSEKRYLKELIESEAVWTFDILKKALENGREKDLDEIEKSKLRGRGGAAFPTYIKWRSAAGKNDVVLICNADEGEPGTFKDRYIMETNPNLLVESLLISAYTLDARQVFIYIRGEYEISRKRIEEALQSAKPALDLYRNKAGSVPEIKIISGGGAYVC